MRNASSDSVNRNVGRLLWAESVPGPIQQFLTYVSSLAMLSLGVAVCFPAVDIWQASREPLSDPVVWIVIVSITFFLSLGCWLAYCAISSRNLKGLKFFETGVECGEGYERRFVPYQDLEVIHFELLDQPEKPDSTETAVHAVVSMIALNPAGVGAALGKSMVEPYFAELNFKAREGKLRKIAFKRYEYDSLVSGIRNSTPASPR